MKIGIFGGTFDPFTVAHYEIVKRALEEKLVDKVVVMPTVVSYYRNSKDVMFTYEQRRQIIEKWFDSSKNVILDFHEYELSADQIEMRRYLDMLKHIMYKYGIENEYYTIIGTDSFYNFKTWYAYEQILKMSKLIVVQRDGAWVTSKDNVNEAYKIPYTSLLIDNRFLSISATKIRERLGRMCESMSMGPSGLPINLYLDEIDEYKENGRTFEDTERIMDEAAKKIDKYIKEHFFKNEGKKIMNKNNTDELLVKTPIFDVMKGPEVEAGFRPVKVKSKDWVTIVVERNGQFLMEKQLRHGLNKTFEEFPCGMVEENEYPMEAALRELEEETGIKVHKFTMKYLGKFAANPAFMTNYMHYFHITIDDKVIDQRDQQLDEHEHIKWYWLDKSKAFENFYDSEGSSIAGCCWMLLMKDGILDGWN